VAGFLGVILQVAHLGVSLPCNDRLLDLLIWVDPVLVEFPVLTARQLICLLAEVDAGVVDRGRLHMTSWLGDAAITIKPQGAGQR
jgi:hypothetical protein